MTKYTIQDWAGNYPFEPYGRGRFEIVKLGGEPMRTWPSFDDAEEFLSEFLGDAYEEARQEYYINEVETTNA